MYRQWILTTAPRTDYAAVVWHRPRADGATAGTTQVRKLTTVQRIAMKAVLGCYRTTPTAAMEIEADLQPTWLWLQTKVLLSTTRMQSLSLRHPIHKWLQNALRTRTANIPHRSNLETILQQFPFMTKELETIEPYIRPPWWSSKTKFLAITGKDAAKASHDELTANLTNDTLVVYTDGSGIDEKVGAAIYNHSTSEAVHQHLGAQAHYNVYAAELTAIHLAVTQWHTHAVDFPNCYIFTDSQAAGTSIQKPRRQSGQSIIAAILDHIDDIINKHPHRKLTVVWIPGHCNIEGNERTDSEAKEAATNPALHTSFNYSPLKSSRIQYIKAAAKGQWTKQWTESTRTARQLRQITLKHGVKCGPKIYKSITNRNISAMIMQLRTGHCGLNGYLNRFGKKDSPYCECGYGKETVEHFLLECRRYRDQRKTLRKSIGGSRMKVRDLLGDVKAIKHTAEYIKATGRLKDRG